MAEIASGSIDLKSLKNTHDDATKYITKIDDAGISIHPYNDVSGTSVTKDRTVITDSGMEIYKNNVSVASFGTDARIGSTANNATRTEITAGGMQIYKKENNADVQIASLGYGNGNGSNGQIGSKPYYTFGTRAEGGTALNTYTQYDSTATYKVGDGCIYNSAMYLCTAEIESPEPWTSSHWQSTIGNYSVAEGTDVLASGYRTHAEGNWTRATGAYAHSEGEYTYAEGYCSHAEGRGTYASEYGAHAEGYSDSFMSVGDHLIGNISATGMGSHAEGSVKLGDSSGFIIASGIGAHAEGVFNITASGIGSHAEGCFTNASGNYSHAGGYRTTARARSQTVIGEYNLPESASLDPDTRGQYALIIGNGVNTASNALTVEWNGDVNIASGAKYKINGNALSASDVSAVPITRTVNGKALSSNVTLSASDVSAVPTTRTVNSKALSSNITLSPSDMSIADFITEQGTDGIWTYRKWNSGIAECWGRYAVTLTKYTTVNSFAGYTSSVAFPSGLFVSGSIPTHTYMATVGSGFAMPASGMRTSNTTMTVYALSTASANNQSCVFDIIAKGRWK